MMKKIKILIILLLVLIIAVLYFAYRNQGDVNVLVLGIDDVEKQSHRSDTIMLVDFKFKEKKIFIISVPRDTIVEYKGKQEKLNSVYAINYVATKEKTAAREVAKKAAEILDIDIPYVVEVNYKAVKEMVDIFGGVRINIEKKMKYHDQAAGLYIDFSPGTKVLDGEDAVKYLRFRSDEKADIGRIDRQQKFVYSFIEKMKASLKPEKVPSIYRTLTKYIYTNLPLDRVVVLYERFKDYKLGDGGRFTLPGQPMLVDKKSCWKIDEGKVEEMMKKIRQ